MCGISGYIGKKRAQPVLVDSLSRLEYRGYDSCGIAVRGSPIKVCKDVVRIGVLKEELPVLRGTVGIGHTRWATHGEPSQLNAHPHTDCSGKIAVVHNGIIDNFQQLRKQLISEGHMFTSETDSEVIPHLIEKYFDRDLEEAVNAALAELEGSYAIIVVSEYERKLIAARQSSPLIIGIGDDEYLVASDVPAVLNYTNRIIYLEDGDMAVINSRSLRITNDGLEVSRKEQRTQWGREAIDKAGYEHYMLKEIHEQPRVISNTLGSQLSFGGPVMDPGLMLDREVETLSIVACGTSYHAGLIGKNVIEELLGIPVAVEFASEISHRSHTLNPTEAIGITQSGETADVLTALKKLRDAGIRTMAITNVPNSSVSRIADRTVYTQAGPEVGVAATKTFIAELITLYQLALSHPGVNHRIAQRLAAEMMQLPVKVQQVLDNEPTIAECARYLSKHNNIFFIGRGINLPVALEGALKLKEISYIYAEGYPAGELKHGPFALLSEATPVIAIVAHDATYGTMLSNIKEIKARKSPVIALVDDTDSVIAEMVDIVLRVPSVSNLFSPVVNTVALQLLAYHTARYRGCPIDFPRNLAKSVTVE